MKKNLLRLFAFAFALISVVSMCTAVFAVDYDDVSDYVGWKYNYQDGKIYCGEKAYGIYEIPMGYGVSLRTEYVYYNIPQYFYYFAGNERDADILKADNEYYLSDQAISVFEYFRNTDNGILSFENSYLEGDEEIIEKIINSDGDKTTLGVEMLEGFLYKNIRLYDCTYKAFFREKGKIFKIEDSYYYIDLDALDNSKFDADGNFSYRSGEVIAVKLEESTVTELTEAISDGGREYSKTIYERNSQREKRNAKNTVIALTVVFGVILPGVFTVLFICRALSKRSKTGYYFFIPAGLGLLWIVLSIVNLNINL